MDFDLTAEQELIRDTVRSFARERVAPVAEELDREARDPFETLDEIEKTLALDTTPLTWPIGSGRAFCGTYDLRHNVVRKLNADIDAEPMKGSGPNDPQIAALAGEALAEHTAGEIELAIGASKPFDKKAFLEAAKIALAANRKRVNDDEVKGIAIIKGAGVRVVDASVAGLGGCPYANGATGNVASEDVVYLLHGMGFATGIALDALVVTGQWISAELGRENGAKLGRALAPAAVRA